MTVKLIAFWFRVNQENHLIIINHSAERRVRIFKTKKEPPSALLKLLFIRVPRRQLDFCVRLAALGKDQKLSRQKLT